MIPSLKTRSIAYCVAIGISFTVWAVPQSYSPFFPEEDYTLSLDNCSTSRDVTNQHPPEGVVTFWQSHLKLTLTMVDFHYVAKVYSEFEPISEAVPIHVQATMPWDVLEEAICDDLNHDGRLDWVITLWLHGNGLGAENYQRLIILSSNIGYRFWLIPTMSPSAEDFITFGRFERIVMVTTSWVNTGDTTDSPHSYFIYDLWTFRDGTVVPANDVDTRFPKWVWMTFGENHKPAVSLNEALERTLRHDFVGPLEALP